MSRYAYAALLVLVPTFAFADGVKSPRDVQTGPYQKTVKTINLGDTGTHEVGHVRKRIDKASPLFKSSSQRHSFRLTGKRR